MAAFAGFGYLFFDLFIPSGWVGGLVLADFGMGQRKKGGSEPLRMSISSNGAEKVLRRILTMLLLAIPIQTVGQPMPREMVPDPLPQIPLVT